MDMNKLFADFTEYVSSMTSQQVKESLSDAMLHSMDSDELLTAEELPEMSMENTPTQSIETTDWIYVLHAGNLRKEE